VRTVSVGAVTNLATSTPRPIVSPQRHRRLRPRARRIGGLIASGLSSTRGRRSTREDSRRASSLPDHHHTVHPDRSEHWAHGIYSGLVDLFFVAKLMYRAQAITAASVARTNSRARLRSGSMWPLVSALIRIPVHFYVSRMWNQPIELTDEANMAATSS
jgi:hypothetical protein